MYSSRVGNGTLRASVATMRAWASGATPIQPVRHMVPEPAANSHAVWAIKRLLANATQAANIALARLAVDTHRLDQNGVPVDPALQPSSLLPSRKHAVV